MNLTAAPPEAVGAELRQVLHDFIARRVGDPDTADDLTQEVLLKAHLSGIEVDDVAAWLYRIARNTVIDHYRHRGRHPRPDDLPPEVAAPEPDDEVDAARALLTRCLEPMVADLEPVYREALTLTDLGELSQAEAARRAGVAGSTMKSRVQRARARLRAAVRACCTVHTDAGGRVHDVDQPTGCGC